MNKIHPSIFRDAMQVSAERIAQMGDTDLNKLMQDLLHAQAYRCRSAPSEIRVNTEGKAKDDGCDGWTTKPEITDEWLGNVETCWQFKAGISGEPARLKNEIIKPIPKNTLKSGGRFVVIASGSTNGKKGEDDRLKTLYDDAKTEGIPARNVEVIGSERLTSWCNQNPAVAAKWAGRPGGMWTLSDWSNSPVHQVPWQSSATIEANLSTHRSELSFKSGTILHLHIHGKPGVGKTRLALELCRKAPWSDFVIYIQQATDLRLQELMDSAAADASVRLVVVADEVQPEQLRPLRESIGRANGQLRLITIGHCPTPDPSRIPAVAVNPLEPEIVSKVVKGWYPGMPREHVDFIVRFADGYIRLARLAANAVIRATRIDVRVLLSRDEIRGFLDGMLTDGDRRALYVVAVLSTVGWTGDKQVEGEVVSKHLGLDWNYVRSTVEDYHRRLEIAPRGGDYRYISPTPLGIHLAAEAWTTYPDLLRSLPEVLPSEGAKDAYYDRLQSMASNPRAREYARQELSFFFRIADFIDTTAVRRWSALSSADPDQAARKILYALKGSGAEDRLQIKGESRREIVWTLVRLSWRSGSFADSVKALALLGEAENETWANNATSEFISKFQIYLGGTAVPYLDRLSVLDELVSENRLALIRLVIRALVRVGDQQVFRMNNKPPSDELPEKEWKPATRKDHLQCIQAALERLIMLVDRAELELQEDFITAAKELAMLLRNAFIRPLIECFFNAVRVSYRDAREPLRRSIADVVYRERKYWKELSKDELVELEAFHASFEDDSLKAQLRQQVGQHYWERGDHPDLRPLAKKLLEADGALVEEWPWLTSGDAGDAWRFGEALAEEDSKKSLADAFISLRGTGRDLMVLCGYICSLRRKLGDDWYNQWVESQLQYQPRPVNLLFDVAWRCGVTDVVAHQIVDVIRTEKVAPEIVGRLMFGKWAEEIDPGILDDILRVMFDNGHRETALAILELRIRAVPGDLKRWRQLALDLIAAPEIIRSRQMTSYYWKELASRFISDYPAEIAAAIIREQAERLTGTWFAEYSEAAQVLQACVEQNPSAVWTVLLPFLNSKDSAYMFSIGFPRGIVDRVPQEKVLAWIDEHPAERALIIAMFANKNLSNEESLAARVLGTYGDIDAVANAFFSEYVSGSWTGDASSHWEQLSTALAEVSKKTKLPKLKNWASKAAIEFKNMADRDRQREEEENLRRL